MRHPSIRGIGIRYALALTLPLTGIALVLFTVAQLVVSSIREPRSAPGPETRVIESSMLSGGARAIPEPSAATVRRPAPKP